MYYEGEYTSIYKQSGGESIASYGEIKNIVLGKLVDKTIDLDYEELSEHLFGDGNCFNGSEVRKRMYGMKTVIEAVEREQILKITDCDLINELEQKRLELQMERQKLRDYRAAFNKQVRDRARQEELNEIITEAVMSGTLTELEYTPAPAIASGSDLLVSLNDIHYGAVVDNYWHQYNSAICCEMMHTYLDKVRRIAI